jgi:hypothetical protein
MATPKESKSEKNPAATLANPPVIVDLGQKTRKKINRLKKGEGPLFDAVCETVEVLQADNVIGKDAHVVVVVVERLPDGVVLPTMPWN